MNDQRLSPAHWPATMPGITGISGTSNACLIPGAPVRQLRGEARAAWQVKKRPRASA